MKDVKLNGGHVYSEADWVLFFKTEEDVKNSKIRLGSDLQDETFLSTYSGVCVCDTLRGGITCIGNWMNFGHFSTQTKECVSLYKSL